MRPGQLVIAKDCGCLVRPYGKQLSRFVDQSKQWIAEAKWIYLDS